MGRKKIPGLYLRNGVWHIDKHIGRKRICESTGESNLTKAEQYLARKIEEIRQAAIYGVRPKRMFRQAATKFLEDAIDNGPARSLERYAQALRVLDPYIGDLPLQQVHMGTLEPYIRDRRRQGRKAGTINRDLAVVRRILNLAARLWRDEHGLSWLETPPLIQMARDACPRRPYPLDWEEQRLLFDKLPAHLQPMALFKVNTGTREQEVCQLRRDWEVTVSEPDTSVFIVPGEWVKNGEDRLIVFNRIATSVIEAQRGKHDVYVFPYKGKQLLKLHTSAWNRARAKAAERYQKQFGRPCPDGFRKIRVHDLKHTFGRRLRAAGVSFEDRQDLLGHKSSRMTTRYSAAELRNLIDAANEVCGENSRKSPALTVLKRA